MSFRVLVVDAFISFPSNMPLNVFDIAIKTIEYGGFHFVMQSFIDAFLSLKPNFTCVSKLIDCV